MGNTLQSRLVRLEMRFAIASSQQKVLSNIGELGSDQRLTELSDKLKMESEWEVVGPA